MNIWSRALLAILLAAAGACEKGVKLSQESENGGVVVYPYNAEQGPVLSAFRKDAIRLIDERCPAGHTIVREGETKGRSRLSTGQVQTVEIILEWGIQFHCK
jgi:hypothetical protein